MSAPLSLHHDLLDRIPDLVVPTEPERFPDPAVVLVNRGLAGELGIDADGLERGLPGWLSGQLPPGTKPVAAAYAGHQFGHLTPQLGDGRAVLVGEVRAPGGALQDVQLKGSGRTVFSRRGDGRAGLDSVLREYIVSEAMAGLGVPTTRALAALTTGERIYRQGHPPGAVLVRVATSHLRVGTLEFLALRDRHADMRAVVELALERHHPQHAGSDNPALALLDAVVTAQAELIAHWMSIGFVHGIMNTDNTGLGGQTIDYGPCAFMERTDPETVFSQVDEGGRYRFGQQPSIGMWNLARLAEALLPILAETPEAAIALAEPIVGTYPERYRRAWVRRFRAKLGLVGSEEGDVDLAVELLDHMRRAGLDFTSTFRTMAEELRASRSISVADAGWTARWTARHHGRSPSEVAEAMDAVNPLYIPRNHRIEEALAAALRGDLSQVHTLIALTAEPFTPREGFEAYAEPAPDSFGAYRTHCNT